MLEASKLDSSRYEALVDKSNETTGISADVIGRKGVDVDKSHVRRGWQEATNHRSPCASGTLGFVSEESHRGCSALIGLVQGRCSCKQRVHL